MWGNGRKWGGFGRFCAGFSFSITHSRIHAIPHRSFVFFVLFVVTQKYSPPFPPRPHRSTPQKPPIFTHFSPFSPRFPSFRPFFDVFRQHSCAFAVQKIVHSRPLAFTQFPSPPAPHQSRIKTSIFASTSETTASSAFSTNRARRAFQSRLLT